MKLLMVFTTGLACVLFVFPVYLHASESTHIAFCSPREGNYEIYILDITDPNGENHLTNLTNHPARDSYPAFSPDGQWLAFVSDRSGTSRIYLMHRNRNELRPLTTHLETNYDLDPDWSPDGVWIVFTGSKPGIPWSTNHIYKINVNTGEVQQLTDAGEDHRFSQWSPDGDRILFSSDREEGQGLYLMKPNGSAVRRVIDRRNSGYNPTWSPDGKQIAYSMFDLGGEFLYIMTDEGQNSRKIAKPESLSPAWSPDGKWIAHEYEVDAWIHPRDSNIHLVSPDGILTRELTKDPGRDRYPAWVPAPFLSVSPTAEKQTTLWGRLKKSPQN